jgi:hypothetical protein
MKKYFFGDLNLQVQYSSSKKIVENYFYLNKQKNLCKENKWLYIKKLTISFNL